MLDRARRISVDCHGFECKRIPTERLLPHELEGVPRGLNPCALPLKLNRRELPFSRHLPGAQSSPLPLASGFLGRQACVHKLKKKDVVSSAAILGSNGTCNRKKTNGNFTRHCCRESQFERRSLSVLACEHKPVFEEGQRLSQHLLDSLLSSYDRNIATGFSQTDSKQLSKRNVDGAASGKHNPTGKQCSARDRVFQHVSKDSNDPCYRDDSDLFSFDDLPVYFEDGDDADDIDVLKSSSLAARKHLGEISGMSDRYTTTCISYPQRQHEMVTLHGAHRDISEVASKKIMDFDTLHDSSLAFRRHNVDEVSQQRKACPKKSMQPPKLLQCVDTPGADLDWKQQCIGVVYNFTYGDKAASPEMGDVSSQGPSFDTYAPSGPLGRAFNQFQFARSYDLVALRVSLADCENLASRLKGHLLNWPRISNIARVQGDDMNWDTVSSMAGRRRRHKKGSEDSILHAVYGTSPPLGQMEKRAKSAKRLVAHRLQYLDCISRPSRQASEKIKEQREKKTNTSKHFLTKFYTVDLLDSWKNNNLHSDTGLPLLGFKSHRWRGPFRLLLLDPKYAEQAKLPVAVQMFLNELPNHGKGMQRSEIVPCCLTLLYQYWSMEEIIKSLLPSDETRPLPIVVLGHVAVLCLGEQYTSVKFVIGRVILDKHHPVVKTVVNKTGQAKACRPPDVEVLAGNHSLVTTIIENETQFLVNLAKVHWDSELAVERWRLIQKLSNNDIVCDVFAGAGALTLPLAKKVWRVFANDPNVDALKYLARNIDDNELHGKVELYNLDYCAFLRKLLAFKRPVMMTQIIFSLPATVESVLDALRGAFIKETWPADQALPTVHVYGYSDTSNPERDFSYMILDKLGLAAEAVELYSVKPYDSGRCLMCASFQLPDILAFDSR